MAQIMKSVLSRQQCSTILFAAENDIIDIDIRLPISELNNLINITKLNEYQSFTVTKYDPTDVLNIPAGAAIVPIGTGLLAGAYIQPGDLALFRTNVKIMNALTDKVGSYVIPRNNGYILFYYE